MGRTASPATPGTDPTPKTDDDLAKDALAAGALAAAATSEATDLQQQVDDLRALVHQLGRNQVAQAVPEAVELPELADVMKNPPSIAVLTKQGWYVPPKLDSQQVKV